MERESRLNPDLLADFRAECGELVDTLIEDLLGLEADPTGQELIQRIFRALHTIKGNAGFMGVAAMSEMAHRAEDAVTLVRNGERHPGPELIDALLLVADSLRTQLEAMAGGAPGPDPAPVLARLVAAVAGTATTPVESGPAAPAAPASAVDRDAHTVRVDVVRIDQLMNQVGELVLERNRLLQLVAELRSGLGGKDLTESLTDTSGRIHSITSELQMNILKVRMVPVERIFRKFPRMVRELSTRLGKEVRFSFSGGDTEVDKSVAEAIVDPLTHLVRNALDHGIESPVERARQGKPPMGEISMRASHEGNSIVVHITDDGAGIDPEKIRRRAVTRGLVSAEQSQELGRMDLLGLIFKPGFSTSDQVSDVSGRGVGLDVVKTNLRTHRGIIEIDSEPGRGTEIRLKLPLTLAIVPSLLVAVAADYFAIPLASVIEVLAETAETVYTMQGRPVLRWRERVVPLLDLGQVFHPGQERQAAGPRKIVVVGLAELQIALLVDALLGQEEVVIKTLGDYLGRVPGIAGGTLLGDGQVALVLDIPGLVGGPEDGALVFESAA